MSWDSYTDNLVKTGHVSQAAVCGLDGSVWAATPGLTVQPNEIKNIVAGFSNSGALQSNGVFIGGNKYMFLQSDDSQIQGKKGASGFSIAKSAKCMVIGIYGDGLQPGNCRTQCERIRDYLNSVGY
jgi:profilin